MTPPEGLDASPACAGSRPSGAGTRESRLDENVVCWFSFASPKAEVAAERLDKECAGVYYS
jgi:hypothetical protein